ncbi:phosphomethylpyrimidine kinase [Cryptococcus neoformans]|nr:phosphomethylpyrimidine kinase [Cryptococcus neoformans var. grubii Bt1]OXC63979.1 phosphomethylpyrimidine kinase [Cryptococcus neoformans var. grubii]OXG19219.1 phosphomethylpyrimidine kinase [Cryptococcus neoformans var. grubii Ze90-1]OXH27579.1 phosphomethylpyrimidine kinase [Cryptococcus neoformans var. grubii]
MTSKNELSLEPRVRPHVMTIAGSDSGGGAGIQADLKTIEAFGCYGSSVLTGLTAQNTLGVQAVHVVPTDFVIQQLQSIISDELPKAIKLGMLTCASTIRALAREVSKLNTTIILDPVMISTSGHTLLPDDAMEALYELYPHVDYLTPNIPEAKKLSGWSHEVKSLDDMVELARKTNERTKSLSVLLKGGHAVVSREEVLKYVGKYELVWEEGDDEDDTVEVYNEYKESLDMNIKARKDLVVDLLVKEREVLAMFVGKKVDSQSTHGTGCTLSTAIACSYAVSSDAAAAKSLIPIFKRAIGYTQSAIATAFSFGHGHGPLNHGHLMMRRALPSPSKHNPHPFLTHLIQSDLPLWKSYVRHPFVVQLGKGTLPRKCFEHYIKQDYHYLKHYARAHALGAYKADSFEDIKAFTEISLHIARESTMHVAYCQEFGLSLADLEETPESANCSAYARYVIDIGTQGDILDLYMAVASCLVGYGEVGLWLKKQVERGEAKVEGNLYGRWMTDYGGREFLNAVNRGIENLERRVAQDPPSPQRLAKLTKIWQECVRLESGFWDMGLNLL